jgi:hypothetical protein
MQGLSIYLFFAIYSFGNNICNAENAKNRPGNIEIITRTKNEFYSEKNASIALDRIISDSHDDRDKIVGGVKSKKGEFPWTVGVWRMKALRPFCGGSLLNNRFV